MKRIESKQNQTVKQWKKLHTKKEREKSGLFIIEGEHLVEEALKYKSFIKHIVVSELFQIPSQWNLDGVSLYLTTDEIIKDLGSTESPQGVIAICLQPEQTIELGNVHSILLIDAVQDPGNLGTLIRTADAAGINGVVLGEGTVDLFNSKVLRASQGSVFHLPIVRGNIGECIDELRNNGISVFGTALEGGKPFPQVPPTKSFALLVGNEGKGVQKEWLSKTNQNLYIPIHGKAESLNVTVAAGILLYYLRG
ncbi:TrmH family RNA methyltransferase [Bacillus suaedaesalsae]|uniref:RNA methyltransferase n=1 Tax=Bacillus suaedaesalsae TaxID=2810349 RepID=A0ABS2DHL1_9BACI|nr:RNA methyltransferase [Bacillus suaedaesalsae]MBM6617520.1 RNA methyltransferase [Bacillus suaedaesalsae]